MFALALHNLNGWAMAAADGARKERAEWPPHPDRVFMALAAAHFETDGGGKEREALEWLGGLPPPGLCASEHAERRTVTSYVPVNDTDVGKKIPATTQLDKLKGAGLGVVPEFRSRQPRGFPVAIPRDPTVHLLWPDAEAGRHRPILDALCRKVTHVGHSASFVQMWVDDAPPPATWVPEPTVAERRLRIAGPGRLADLERCLNRADCLEYRDREDAIKNASARERKALKAEQARRFPDGAPVSRRPEPGLWQGYARPQPSKTPDMPGSVFDPRLVVLTLSGRRPGLRATLKLTTALRGALLANCPPPIPEWVSGHEPDGRPSQRPHVSLLPLPFVGAEHADGHVLGLALALPAGLAADEVSRVLTPWLTDPLRLFDGEWLECTVAPEEREAPPWNLRPEAWTRPARRWATVTPIVFDRHPKGDDLWEQAAEMVKDACERIGLPRPVDVTLHPVSRVVGVPRASEFAPIERKRSGRLRHSHAAILFGEPVRGPVVLGAGRYRGYGLCRPDDPREGEGDSNG
ncbi:MAG: type I-U CRISPR-associated protein Cas5/Cas6 [Deltaproteobacteria bacterium]|nr:type I-U CRISPR-associated protein Cas5/Cas6 [Deltaproteobacteria bacterium]